MLQKRSTILEETKQYLSQLVFKQNVTLSVSVMNATNVFWQRFYLQEQNINLEMVKNGDGLGLSAIC